MLRLTDVRPVGELHPRERFVAANLLDTGEVGHAFDGIDAVIRMGAIADEAAFEELLGPNLVGTFNVFEAARRAGVRRVIYARSNRITGFSGRSTAPWRRAGATRRALRRAEGLRRSPWTAVRGQVRAGGRLHPNRLVPGGADGGPPSEYVADAERYAERVPADGVTALQGGMYTAVDYGGWAS